TQVPVEVLGFQVQREHIRQDGVHRPADVLGRRPGQIGWGDQHAPLRGAHGTLVPDYNCLIHHARPPSLLTRGISSPTSCAVRRTGRRERFKRAHTPSANALRQPIGFESPKSRARLIAASTLFMPRRWIATIVLYPRADQAQHSCWAGGRRATFVPSAARRRRSMIRTLRVPCSAIAPCRRSALSVRLTVSTRSAR